MIHPVRGRIFSHGRYVLEFVEKVFVEVHVQIIELLDTLTLVHMARVEWVDAKVIDLLTKSNIIYPKKQLFV